MNSQILEAQLKNPSVAQEFERHVRANWPGLDLRKREGRYVDPTAHSASLAWAAAVMPYRLAIVRLISAWRCCDDAMAVGGDTLDALVEMDDAATDAGKLITG